MSTQLAISTDGYDNPTRATVEAAAHLVAYRDGLMGHLMWLAERTTSLSGPDAAVVFQRLLVVLGKDESYRRGVQISHLATTCWGDFRDAVPARRLASVDLLRRVCLDTATAVRDAIHRDSCVCEVTR